MKRIKYICVVIILIINSLSVFSNGESYIESVLLSSNVSREGAFGYVSISVVTQNVGKLGRVTAELVNYDDSSLTPAIKSNSYSVISNKANISLAIPDSTKAGNYYIKVTLTIPESDIQIKKTAYSIYSSSISKYNDLPSPLISNLSTTNAILVEGVVDGYIDLIGNNFSNNDSLNIISLESESNESLIYENINIIQSSLTHIKFEVPSEILEGIYNVNLLSNNKKSQNSVKLTIKKREPVIKSVDFSSGSVNIYGLIKGDIVVNGGNFLGENVECSILNENGEKIYKINEVVLSNLEVSFKIPETINEGKYFINIIVDGNNVVSKTSFEIVSKGVPVPVIQSIDTSNGVFVKDKISGYIIINGTNLSPNPVIEFINTNGIGIIGKTMNIEVSKVTVQIPSSLDVGYYDVKLTNIGKEDIRENVFKIIENNQEIVEMVEQVDISQGFIKSIIDNAEIYEVDIEEIKSIFETFENEKKEKISLRLEGSLEKKSINLNKEVINEIINNSVGIEILLEEVGVEIPIKFFEKYRDESLDIKIEKIDKEYNKVEKMKNGVDVGNIIKIEIVNSSDESIKQFKNELKIVFPFDEKSEINNKKLGIYYYDEEKEEWNYTGGKYDSVNKQIYTYINHLTNFGLFEYSKNFTDVSVNHWARNYIEILTSKHIIDGIDEELFSPELDVTRAQFTKLLVAALDIETIGYEGKFKDVKEGSWYTKYIEAAEREGIVSGYDGNIFKPNEKINREQMAVMVVNTYNYKKGENIYNVFSGAEEAFDDFNEVSSWAKDSVNAAYKLGFVNGIREREFVPKDNSTRAQAATIIYRFLDEINMF